MIMVNLKCIKSEVLTSNYNRVKVEEVLKKVFETDYKNYTQISNTKTFQIKFSSEGFRVKKIDKLMDSSDPLYMALTEIKGVVKTASNGSQIVLFSEINSGWLYCIILGLILGIVGSVFYDSQFLIVIPILLAQYFIFRYLAAKDLELFAPYFEVLIKNAKVKAHNRH